MGDERDQIVAAITKAVADYGYDGITLEGVLRQAQVSPEVFAAHFGSLEQGLAAAQQAFLDRVRFEAASACDLERAWPENVRAALDAVLGHLAEASALARGFIVEATASSLAANQRRFYPQAERMPNAGRFVRP